MSCLLPICERISSRYQYSVRNDAGASSQAVRRWLDQVDDELLHFSVISLSEILKGIFRLPDGQQRIKLQDWLDNTLHLWFVGRILPINQPIAERLGIWSGERAAKGLHLPMADGLIAATAIKYDLKLVTRNVKDFNDLGVSLFNPWEHFAI